MADKCPHCGADVGPTEKICGACYELGRPLPAAAASTAPASRVLLVDIDMPFSSMVGFMLKWALAAIPAVIILTPVFYGLLVVFAGVFGE